VSIRNANGNSPLAAVSMTIIFSGMTTACARKLRLRLRLLVFVYTLCLVFPVNMCTML